MLNKTQRLSTNRISWLLKKGFNFRNEYFSIKFHLNKSQNSRYSVVVSKKIAALATDRNLLRRQFYEIIRNSPERLPPADYIIMVRNQVSPLSFEEKKTLLNAILSQINSKLN